MKKILLLNLIFSLVLISYGKNGIFLEGLSATSIHKNYEKYGPEKCFDGKDSTEWLTMPGAARDEGLQLFFNEPLEINYIKINPASKGNILKNIALYINGSYYGTHSITEKIKVNTKAYSIFIRLKELKDYNAKNSTGLSEISFYDKNDKIIRVNSPLIKKGKIIASSSLAPEESYNTDFLFDSRKDFGWADGNSKKNGIGEYIKFIFSEDVSIKKIKIWNGYLRSVSHYKANERAKKIKLSSGSTEEFITLKDNPQAQVINLSKNFSGKEFKMDFMEVYKGQSYKDLVISEIRFFDGNNWFIMDSGNSKKRKEKILSSVKNSPLEKIIDKSIKNNNSELTSSIILRSNGSFVLYSDTKKPGFSQNIIADGNWQLLKNNNKGSRVKIFGRLKVIEEQKEVNYNPYSGESEAGSSINQSEKIFNDIIDINNLSIKSGKKLFQDFKI